MRPFAKCFSIAHIRRKLHCVHLPNISSGCFDQPSFGLWARRASSAPRWWVVIGWFRSTSSDILLVGTLPLRFNDFHVIVWFRSTSSDILLVGTHPLRFNDSFNICPPRETSFSTCNFIFDEIIPSHIFVTDFTVSIFLFFTKFNICNANIYFVIVSILQFSLCPSKRYIMCPNHRT